MPIIDGLHLLEELGRHSELAGVPVMIMSEQASDLIRLRAFQLGAMDFIPKPFTVLEVILRARRIARGVARDPERVVLRGALTELGLPPLLTMLDQERKNGILSITRDDQIAWISFANGRIIKVRATELDGDSLTLLMHVLDWTEGHFELAVGVQEDQPEIDLAVTHALLEHARRRDEATRAP
jgi:DNA-binding response OmpR family regulator